MTNGRLDRFLRRDAIRLGVLPVLRCLDFFVLRRLRREYVLLIRQWHGLYAAKTLIEQGVGRALTRSTFVFDIELELPDEELIGAI